MKSPILFLVFNRIHETRQSFDIIRKARPPRLYVAADGPRDTLPPERDVCNAVREIATNIDWECKVFTLFRENNLGCKKAVVGAIDWFFENESEGIIIEDDVIPNDDFFPFCDLLLEKFRNDHNIKAINGFNQFGQEVISNSYFFSRGYYPWGWATWKSRWANYKADSIDISRLNDSSVREIYHQAAIEGVKFNLSIIEKGILDTWDYQMVYMIMSEKGFVVAPYANLTSNIGVNGAHSTNNQNIFFKYGKMEIDNLIHPEQVTDTKIMNDKLWEEYKAAHLSVKIKTLLLKAELYQHLRRLYKTVVKRFLFFF